MNKKLFILIFVILAVSAAAYLYFAEKPSSAILCKVEQRNIDACAAIYDPVCAKVNIQCIKAPCDPINQTFSNSCTACNNPLVESYAGGECK